jgi:hypothetical protein
MGIRLGLRQENHTPAASGNLTSSEACNTAVFRFL